MYSKKDIEKTLVEFNYFIDETTLSQFIKNWKIDAIYEDEDGIEFFDNLAISKLKKGISLKSQGFTNEQIIYHINKLLPEKIAEQEKQEAKQELPPTAIHVESQESPDSEVYPVNVAQNGSELKNVTIDITHQTLQLLADTVAQKITNDIKDKILGDGSLKEDNEVLTKKVDELTKDNQLLAKRIAELENEKKASTFNFDFIKSIFK